jgi:hypothetical protein
MKKASSMAHKPKAARPEKSQEEVYRKEAERLALLPVEDQREIVALHKAVAENAKLPKEERESGRQRAEALERFLGLQKKPRIK